MRIKNLLGIILILAMTTGCDIRNSDHKAAIVNQQASAEGNNTTHVQLIDSTHNFGRVTDGEHVVFNYRFRNSGDKPLIISSATASCGCTVPEKPEQPIAQGELGYIKVVFDSKGRVGPVHKEIHVVSNARPGFSVLQLTGEVLPAKP